MRDYLENLGVSVAWEQAHWRVKYKSEGVRFTQIDREELVCALNAGMAVALPFYSRNVERSGYQVAERTVLEASFAVVLEHVHLYNSWRHVYDRYRGHNLAISAEDLIKARGTVIYYCRRNLGARYADTAAALTGMSRESLADYEAAQAAFSNAK